MLLGDLEVGEAGDDRCYALRARRTSCRILPTDCGAAEGPLLRGQRPPGWAAESDRELGERAQVASRWYRMRVSGQAQGETLGDCTDSEPSVGLDRVGLALFGPRHPPVPGLGNARLPAHRRLVRPPAFNLIHWHQARQYGVTLLAQHLLPSIPPLHSCLLPQDPHNLPHA